MKNYLLSTFLFVAILNLQSNGQLTSSHQSQSPPVNPGYPFTRGMFIDCSDKIIYDVSIGNPNAMEQKLADYISNNYIGYVVLCGLEYGNVFGNPSMETALRKFMNNLRASFPGIQIGIGASDTGSFQYTGHITVPSAFGYGCYPNGFINNLNEFKNALNDSGTNAINLKRAELCKFFYRAAAFSCKSINSKKCTGCFTGFDSFYLSYRYWNQTTSLVAMQNEFVNFTTTLSLMKVLKCFYSCIKNVDAEFLPTDLFKLQGWTAIDQITDADPLADRLILPVFTNNANGVFDQICKTLHYLSDRFSKPQSRLFIELSAESNSFSYYNSTAVPNDYLGNYLNGTSTPSGNMYSIENSFLNKFNDTNYMCQTCSCWPYADNHFSAANIWGNDLSGVMWTPYSMMNDHNLFRMKKNVPLMINTESVVSIQLIDINGRVKKNYESPSESKEGIKNSLLTDGIYFLRKIYSDGKSEIEKVFIQRQY